MFGRMEKRNPIGDDPRNGRLLHEIEALSRALYLRKKPPPRNRLPSSAASSEHHRSISAGKTHFPEPPKTKPSRVFREGQSQKEKKSSSLWSWKSLKALSHIRHRRFNCRFSLQVHSIEGLPPEFDGVSFVVQWRRRDGGLETRPARVFHGAVEFEETLSHTCSIYGSRNGPHHSAKYEAKFFMLCGSIVGFPDLDLGKHRVDLTRLLPLTLEELEEEKSSGKWSTSFKLSGKAKGATLNVSFGYLVLGDDSINADKKMAHESPNSKQNRKSVSGFERADSRATTALVGAGGSLPGVDRSRNRRPRAIEDVKVLHEVPPTSRTEVSTPVDVKRALANWKLGEGELGGGLVDSRTDNKVLFSDHDSKLYSFSDAVKDACEIDCEDAEFTVIEQGVEINTKDLVKAEEDGRNNAVADNIEINEVSGEEGMANLEVMYPDQRYVAENIEVNEVSGEEGVAHLEVMNPDQPYEIFTTNSEEFSLLGHESKEDSSVMKESVLEELDSALCDLSILEVAGLDSALSQNEVAGPLNCSEMKLNYKKSKMGRSLSLDDATASVASEFLNMLGIEHSPFGMSSDSDPESPRERLLKQFEKESLAGGSGMFGLDFGKEMEVELYNDPIELGSRNLSEEFEFSSLVCAAEAEHQKVTQAMESKTRAKMLEDAEAEALMQEWGLNENTFQRSAPGTSDGFGSPIETPPEGPFELPPLGEGLGPFVQTKDGGFLRSMSPSLFKNAKSNGSLIMQVSSPVVVPAEMGSGIMEILQGLASVGIEKLSMQAKKLMPLEDITGKTMPQVAWEAMPALEAYERQDSTQCRKPEGLSEAIQGAIGGRKRGKKSSSSLTSSMGDTDSEYVSLEDLAPLAMDKIEALSIEGLRIQSGMSDEEAPANISSQSVGEISALEGLRAKSSGSLGLEGAAGLQLMDIKDSGGDVDGLMGLSITLDEWMRLDAGIVDEEEQGSSRMSKILAAHRANCTDFVSGGWKGDKRGKGSGRRCGLLGNNFTVALMVQLRDPLRNYEPVGTPMLSLIQVERVFIPPKPKIYHNVSLNGNSEEVDEPEPAPKEEKKEEEEVVVPQFKITEVHVAGLKTEPDKKKLWGTTKQQQSGSRWLLASGMGKSNKHPLMKSKTLSKSPQATTTVQPGDTLWSISSRVHGTGAKWKELAALNPHIRNPNVIFPNETIRLR